MAEGSVDFVMRAGELMLRVCCFLLPGRRNLKTERRFRTSCLGGEMRSKRLDALLATVRVLELLLLSIDVPRGGGGDNSLVRARSELIAANSSDTFLGACDFFVAIAGTRLRSEAPLCEGLETLVGSHGISWFGGGSFSGQSANSALRSVEETAPG